MMFSFVCAGPYPMPAEVQTCVANKKSSLSLSKAKRHDMTARTRRKNVVVILMKREGYIYATGTNWRGSVRFGATENHEDNFPSKAQVLCTI